jgi:hypothetical protein
VPGFLKGRFNTNEIVVTMMMNSIVYWLIAYMIKEGGPFMGGGGEGQGFTLSESVFPPTIMGGTFTIPIALGVAALLYWMLAKTTQGYRIRAFGPARRLLRRHQSEAIPLLAHPWRADRRPGRVPLLRRRRRAVQDPAETTGLRRSLFLRIICRLISWETLWRPSRFRSSSAG